MGKGTVSGRRTPKRYRSKEYEQRQKRRSLKRPSAGFPARKRPASAAGDEAAGPAPTTTGPNPAAVPLQTETNDSIEAGGSAPQTTGPDPAAAPPQTETNDSSCSSSSESSSQSWSWVAETKIQPIDFLVVVGKLGRDAKEYLSRLHLSCLIEYCEYLKINTAGMSKSDSNALRASC